MEKDIVIVGNGGFAHEVAFLIENINKKEKQWNFLGYIDEKPGLNVIGTDDYLLKLTKDIYVAVAIGKPEVREKIVEKYRYNRYIHFPNLIDPSVIFSDNMKIGKGNIICAGTILTVDIEIGDFNIINLVCTVGHNSKLGDYNIINPGSCISGDVTIEGSVEIGTGTKIIQGLRIGKNVLTGAGTVVIKDIEDYCKVVGVPAKFIGKVE